MIHLETPAIPKPSPIQSAKQAGLRYVSDEQQGISRIKRGKNFRYRLPDGSFVKDHNELIRIKRLAIPPAWTDVWISPFPNGHLQATGRDARRRKQYRYHADWRSVRDDSKFSRMMAFGGALPGIRKRVSADLKLKGLPRARVLATVVRLLETTLIRVGNDEYAKHNGSFGLTTMLDDHARIRGGKVRFAFKGKSGIEHKIDVHDPELARLVKKCQDLPGQEIFAYLDEKGNVQDVTSQDVNDYLREITGQDFTAKDFRTWAGTVLAAVALREFEPCHTAKHAKKNVVRAIEAVAEMLGNTPSVCRKCYVHPAVLESYLQGTTIATLAQEAASALRSRRHLKPDELAVMRLLQQRLSTAPKGFRSATRAGELTRAMARSISSRGARPARTEKSPARKKGVALRPKHAGRA
jgi:DNA topoisomerase-1